MASLESSSKNLPVHLGLILDGNRRWAKERGLAPFKGHKAGYTNLKEVVQIAFQRGVKYVSAYVFSVENWGRSKEEVDYLMKLLLWVAKSEVNEYNKQNIKVVFIGEQQRLSSEIKKQMRLAEQKTADNDGGTLVICLNYSGKYEIASAFKKIIGSGVETEDITPELIDANLYRPEVPDLDLIVRTSGEQRISNFMLWRAAYSELYFTDTYWPDFNEVELDKALAEYSTRQRRFGKDSAKTK